MKWINELYIESIFSIFDKQSLFCQFWTLFGHFSDSTNINESLTGKANGLYWKNFEMQNSTDLTLLKHQNTKTVLYKLPKIHGVIALFEISGPVRNKSLVTVSLDCPVVWIEFCVKNIESNIEFNHFATKFKHRIESDRVSPNPWSYRLY